MVSLHVNGRQVDVAADDNAPLLWVLREHLGLVGTKFGCGIGMCGACTVHLDGIAVRSCVVPAASAVGHAIITIEGLSPDRSHPLQKAWIEEQTPQCGYCQAGQIMQAAALLQHNPAPTRAEIIQGMTNLCRCGTYLRILRSVERAAAEMAEVPNAPTKEVGQ